MVDSNVIIYAYDPTDSAKQTRAQTLIADLIEQDNLTVSAQVLNEFYNAATRPNKPPSLSHERATEIVENIAAASLVLPLTAAVTLRAIHAMPRYNMSLWDALIWAAARENDIKVIYTEDTQSAPEIEGVRYINPFVDISEEKAS